MLGHQLVDTVSACVRAHCCLAVVPCFLQRVQQETEEGLKGAVEVLLIEVFGDTERSLAKVGALRTCCVSEPGQRHVHWHNREQCTVCNM